MDNLTPIPPGSSSQAAPSQGPEKKGRFSVDTGLKGTKRTSKLAKEKLSGEKRTTRTEMQIEPEDYTPGVKVEKGTEMETEPGNNTPEVKVENGIVTLGKDFNPQNLNDDQVEDLLRRLVKQIVSAHDEFAIFSIRRVYTGCKNPATAREIIKRELSSRSLDLLARAKASNDSFDRPQFVFSYQSRILERVNDEYEPLGNIPGVYVTGHPKLLVVELDEDKFKADDCLGERDKRGDTIVRLIENECEAWLGQVTGRSATTEGLQTLGRRLVGAKHKLELVLKNDGLIDGLERRGDPHLRARIEDLLLKIGQKETSVQRALEKRNPEGV